MSWIARCRTGSWVLLAALVVSTQAGAWGSQGHQVVAAMAWELLQPATRQEVNRLLALEPGETLESLSTWADEHRNPATGPWHYVNFPRGNCQYEAQRDCPDGHCVVAAIERERAVWASNANDKARLKALKYLIHFVGDIHQPLHAGYRDDRGGNQFQLRAFMRGSNLHAVWDSGLLHQLDLENQALVALLEKMPMGSAKVQASMAEAAEESCRLVATPSFYPPDQVDQAYVKQFSPVMLARLATAARRLAWMLDTTPRQPRSFW
jgi:nuclease S1